MVLKVLIMGILIRFGDSDSDYFCALKVLVDLLILFLDKNISIHDAKSA